MKAPLFEFPSFQYQIKDWDFKKKRLIKESKKRSSLELLFKLLKQIDKQVINPICISFKVLLLMNLWSSARKQKYLAV